MKDIMIIHEKDGTTKFLPRHKWETALDWESVKYEKIPGGERLVVNGQVRGILLTNRRKVRGNDCQRMENR